MPSFIFSQRRNVDRLFALILLWNVAAGAFVTLGAPWLSEMAGTTGLRPVLPSGRGWLAIGVPTHFAGLWLCALGGYALYRMRRHLRWHPFAVLFYVPQTFAITSPLHVDMWMGLFAATSFEPPTGWAIAFNWIAITLLLVHAVLWLLDSKYGQQADESLSRSALALRYASIAMITAIVLLPFLPRDIFYPSQQTSQFAGPYWLDKETAMLLGKLLLLPVTFVIAYVMAFAWSGSQRGPRFSARRGLVAAMLSYVYLGMTTDLMARWLSDGQELWFRLFVIGFVFLMPWTLLVPGMGALAGDRLGRKVAPTPELGPHGASRLTAGMWMTLVTPLLALLLSYVLDAPKRDRIEAARSVALRALEHFDQNAPEQLYAMYPAESQAMIDRDAFIATLKERRDTLGELREGDAREELRHDWYPRPEIIQFDFSRAGSRGQSNESIVIDIRDPTPTLAAVFMHFDAPPPAHNIYVPRHRACSDNDTQLYCGGSDARPPRSLF